MAVVVETRLAWLSALASLGQRASEHRCHDRSVSLDGTAAAAACK